MYITLTNAAEAHRGNKISINADLIATIHEAFVGEGDVTELKTFVFCPPHGTWEVCESLENIVTLLNGVPRVHF
mgnify:CR=1 FL=1